MMASSVTMHCNLLSMRLLPSLLSSSLNPYKTLAFDASRPLAGIRDTSIPKILLLPCSTAKVTESGLHLVSSKVSRSSNWIIEAGFHCKLRERKKNSAFKPRKRNFLVVVVRWIFRRIEARLKDTPELRSFLKSSFF